MEKAKNAVSSFLHKSGSHKTDVEENVAPAVTRETIKPHRHEETTQAVDRESHQHHYHTTVQPVSHTEQLPEKHTHNLLPTQERQFREEDEGVAKQRLAADLSKFIDSSKTERTTHTQAHAPTQVGEHVHHHVHETVVPIIHKETHQPTLIHTVKPIHEVHHAPSEHHGLSQLPTKTLHQAQQDGMISSSNSKMSPNSRKSLEYDGCPRPYSGEFLLNRTEADKAPHKHDGLHDLEGTGHPPSPRSSRSMGSERVSSSGSGRAFY